MAGVANYQLNLSGKAVRLSDVYGGTPGVPDPTTDIPYRWLTFQADGGDVYLGSDNTVTSSQYGLRLGQTTLRDATGSWGPFGSGAVRLSDFWAFGAPGTKLHFLGLRF